MTEIGRVPAHKTTHQDGGNDELVLTGILPGAHKTSHQDAGADEIEATGLVGRCDFVQRGDPAAADYAAADFTFDDAWHAKDISAIIPAGAKAVLLHMEFTNPSANNTLNFRKNGNSNAIARVRYVSQVSGTEAAFDAIVFLPSTRIIDYNFASTTWAGFIMTVLGWWT